MQKKSLLVALFCGALCLTGCLKNEESASVAQVRIAKANELNSIADLNKAKAAAEAVYAQAELTVAQAEAKLREANAALVLAQAETEKVRAELLKVQVKLAEVVVEEEKVKLQLLEADLEKHLAEVEAAVAMAEAEKQGWINVMEHAVADAERQALVDAKAILLAQDDLQKYILTQEGAKADSAKAAGAKYFAALRQIQALQLRSIETKAQKALVEAGALEIRDAIHYGIDKIDEEIAKKETLLAYLKEYQEMTPEEAEAALLEARKELTDAYNAYMAAKEVKETAKDVMLELDKKHADFVEKWDATATASALGKFIPFLSEDVLVDDLKYTGLWVIKDGKPEFVPFWNKEQPTSTKVRYPNTDVYGEKKRDYVMIKTTDITPAAIYYDNIKVALDTAIAHREWFAGLNVNIMKGWNDIYESMLNDGITANKEKIALHKKYIDARKDTVEKYENAYLAELAKVDQYNTKKANAWETFQQYMLINHDYSKALLDAYTAAESAYNTAKKDSSDAKTTLDGYVSGVETDSTAVTEKFEEFIAAEGAYQLAKDKAQTTAATNKLAEVNKAINRWNPDFAKAATTKKPTATGAVENPTASSDTLKYSTSADATQWKIVVGTNSIKAGGTQDSTLVAQYNLKVFNAKLYKAEEDIIRYPEGTDEYTSIYKPALDKINKSIAYWTDQLTKPTVGLQDVEGQAKLEYEDRYAEYLNIVGTTIDVAKKAWNPDFSVFTYVTFPTEAYPTNRIAVKNGTNVDWTKEPPVWKETILTGAGTSQVALMNAVLKYVDDLWETNPNNDGSAAKLYNTAKTTAESKLATFNDIKAQMGGKLDEEAAKLYKAYNDIKNESKVVEAENALKKAYTWYPDKIVEWSSNMNTGDIYNAYGDNRSAQFSWMKSNYYVDYNATVIDLAGGKGERIAIADLLYGKNNFWRFVNSYQWQVEYAQNEIAALPDRLADYTKAQNAEVADYKTAAAALMQQINGFKAYEAGYQSWVADREKAEAAFNEAKKAEFDAKVAYKEVEAEYEALEATANGYIWIYDPDNDEANDDKFVNVPVNEAIKQLEGDTKDLFVIRGGLMELAGDALAATADQKVTGKEMGAILKDIAAINFENLNSIAGLNFTKALLQEALKVGKVTLQVVLDAFDAELAVIDEEIDLQTKVAAVYKAIMNGWLGIVEESEGETAPLDGEGEGDDEE